MAPDKGSGKSVFIGNIPYGVSEEQIIDIFGRVGHVNSFRLVHDKETGRPKGFGFLEYADPDNAAAAVRNLNEHEIMGRTLRVDWSNDSGAGGGGSGGGSTQDQTQAPPSYSNGYDSSSQPSTLPPIPAGTDAPPGLSAADAISQTLSALPAPQLIDIISQMKGMIEENPAQVTQLLTVAPQLAYAVFQALLLLGLTTTEVLTSIVQGASAPPAAAPPPPPHYGAPVPPPGYPSYPQQPGYAPTPPMHQPPYQPPQPQPVVQQQDSQQAIIQRVISMTAQEIHALEPSYRNQLIALRAQLGYPV